MKVQIFILLILLNVNCALAQEANPLIGEWKSNKELSMKYGVNYDSPNKKQIEAYSKLLGKLRITFTENEYITNLEGYIDKGTYKLIGQEGNNIKILVSDVEYIWVIEKPNTIYQKLGGIYTGSALKREYFTRQ